MAEWLLLLLVGDRRSKSLEGDLVIGFAVDLDRLRRRRSSRSLRPAHELHALRDDLDHVALLAVLRLPVPGLQAPLDHDRASLVEVFAAALGLLAPHDDVQEAGVLPLFAALRLIPAVHGKPQICDRHPAGRIAELWCPGQIADQEYLVQAGHQTASSTTAGRCCFGVDLTRFLGGTRVDRKRNTCSLRPSCRSNSLIVAGVAEHSITAYVPSRCLRISYARRRLPQLSALPTAPPRLVRLSWSLTSSAAISSSVGRGSKITRIS